jgi:hypothetical protein
MIFSYRDILTFIIDVNWYYYRSKIYHLIGMYYLLIRSSNSYPKETISINLSKIGSVLIDRTKDRIIVKSKVDWHIIIKFFGA